MWFAVCGYCIRLRQAKPDTRTAHQKRKTANRKLKTVNSFHSLVHSTHSQTVSKASFFFADLRAIKPLAMRIPALIFCLLSVVVSASAQSDTSYHLLWYKGKKVKPNVLLTPKGDSVFFNKEKGTVKLTSKAGQSTQLDKMLTELNRNNRRMDEMVKKLSAAVPVKKLLPVYAVQVKKAYDKIKEDYAGPLSNTISIPVVTIPGIQPGTGKGGHTMTDIDIEQKFDEYVAELKEYVRSHKDDIISWVPAPPRYDYSYCYPCDKERQDQYQRDFEVFISELNGTDQAVIQKAFGASRQAHLLLASEKNEQIQKDLSSVIDFIFDRSAKRARVLMEKYIDDPYRVHAVMQVALTTDRSFQLTRGTNALGDINYMELCCQTLGRFIEKSVQEKDYSVALNLNFILSTERTLQLIGSTLAGNILEKAFAFNQFKMNMHVSAKLGNDDGHALAEVKADNWFYAIPDEKCQLEWILVGPYLNKMKVDLVETELKGKGGQIPYVGTKNWNSDIPKLKVDFCKKEPADTIVIYPFHPEGFQELWQYPQPWGVKNVITVSGVFQSCFMDVERLKEDYATYKNPENVEKLKKEMVAKYQQMLKNNKTHTVAIPPDEMHGEKYRLVQLGQWAEMQRMSKGFSEIVQSVNPGRFLFTPVVYNKNSLIIQDKINGKVLFPQNGAIEYAWFHLQLEHDPEGPYRIHVF